MSKFESIRQFFIPNKIAVLFIAESPPAKGDFFYYKKSDLYKFTKDAFLSVYGDLIDKSNFLDFFKKKNFFLDDLCHKPINHLDEIDREKQRKLNIPKLSKRIRVYYPEVIIGIMYKIQNHVDVAIEKSNINLKKYYFLPFPTKNKRNINNYIEGLISALEELKLLKLIK